MCARRFLMVVFFITLLAVAAAFAIFQFGDRVLIKSAVPTGHFQAAEGGGDPDYSKAENWVARPDLPTDPSHWLPAGMSEEHLGNAAIFYIHPTTYLERDRWNAPLRRRRHGLPHQPVRPEPGERVQRSAKVWAPRYRQAAFGAFLLNSADATKALDLAYRDVSAAFDEFLTRSRRTGRSSSPHTARARCTCCACCREDRREADRRAHRRRLCRRLADQHQRRSARRSACAACQTGRSDWLRAVVAELRRAGQSRARARMLMKVRQVAGDKRRREDMLCVNPISGTQNGAAPSRGSIPAPRAHRGPDAARP